jgi:hypothetical protein
LKKKTSLEKDICTFSPKINHNSQRIVYDNYLNQFKDNNDKKYCKQIELYENYKINQKKREKLQEDYYDAYNFQPQINRNDITVSFSERQEAFKVKINEKKFLMSEEYMTDMKNGQKLFSPKILKRNSSDVNL